MASPRFNESGVFSDSIRPATAGGSVDMSAINTLIPVPQEVSAGSDQTIPALTQVVTFGTLTVRGTIRCVGDLLIKA